MEDLHREIFGVMLEMGARRKLYESAIRARLFDLANDHAKQLAVLSIRARKLLELAQGSAPRR
jgi:hypothetical protein